MKAYLLLGERGRYQVSMYHGTAIKLEQTEVFGVFSNLAEAKNQLGRIKKLLQIKVKNVENSFPMLSPGMCNCQSDDDQSIRALVWPCVYDCWIEERKMDQLDEPPIDKFSDFCAR